MKAKLSLQEELGALKSELRGFDADQAKKEEQADGMSSSWIKDMNDIQERDDADDLDDDDDDLEDRDEIDHDMNKQSSFGSMQPQDLHKVDSSQETNLLFKSKEQPKAKDMFAGLEERKDDDDDELDERAEPEDEDGNNQQVQQEQP